MAKKKSDKETEPKKVSTKRFSAFLKNETTHFVIGLISVIFYMIGGLHQFTRLLIIQNTLVGGPRKEERGKCQ